MTGRRPFEVLKRDWTPERSARNAGRKAELLTLEALRRDLGLSQEQIARALDIQQPAVSKLENRADMRISTRVH